MALAATIEWEVRQTGGNANNGGGFNSAAAGTDYSQQDNSQGNGTNLTVDASTNTDVTPDGYTVGSSDVGNIVRISTNTGGWTAGYYEIVSIQGGTKWRLDRSPAATSTSGGTWRMGGALTNFSTYASAKLAGHKTWIKGTITHTASPSFSGFTAGATIEFEGYSSTRGDKGKATITSATNSVHSLQVNAARGLQFKYITFTSTATSRGEGIHVNGVTIDDLYVLDCVFDGVNYGFNQDAISSSVTGLFRHCEFKNTVAAGMKSSRTANYHFHGCDFHDNTSHGVDMSGNFLVYATFRRCVFDSNGGDGINWTPSSNTNHLHVDGCAFYNNSSDGIDNGGSSIRTGLQVINSIFVVSSGGYGVKWNTTAPAYADIDYNAFYLTGGSTNYSNLTAGANDVTLSGNPWTDAANRDFTLNNTAGAGAACRGAGYPSTLP